MSRISPARQGHRFEPAGRFLGRDGAVALLALIVSAFLWSQANAHNAPSGWSYDIECCSGVDCYQAPPTDVRETKDGYLLSTGELIPYSDRRIRRSRDEFFHECKPGGMTGSQHSLCLYVPERGM